MVCKKAETGTVTMFEAQRQWSDRYGPLADRFRYQYVISKSDEELDGFARHDLGAFHIFCGPSLPTKSVHDKLGRHVGILLGIAAGTGAKQTKTDLTLPFSTRVKDFWGQFEAFLVNAAGRYAFVMQVGDDTRLYTDPVGMIGAVYNAEDGYVASSPLLTIKRPVRFNPKFDRDIVERGGRFSLFHTADEGVRRLNPNCFLDLNDLTETRFWPRDESFAPEPGNPTDIYAEIIATSRANIGEVAEAHPCSLPVSGGMDSRLLLGFSGDHLSKIKQVYTHINNYATRRDAAIGAELCRVIGVAHDVHDKRQFGMSRKEIRRAQHAYYVTFGAPVSLPKEYLNGVINGVPDGNIILRGHQTDLLRAVYVFKPEEHWRDPDWQIERLFIVPRNEFDTSVAKKYRDDFMAWQQTLPDNAMTKAADFMFLEVYYNSTVGASFPALWRNFYMSPFNSRRLITLSLQFGEKRRRAAKPVFELIELMHEDLSKVPFDFEAPASMDDPANWSCGAPQTEARRQETIESIVAISK
jgi:hypothetical protein